VPTVHAGHYNHLPDKCIGHQEPIKWPPQSRCFMPCDDGPKGKSTNHNPKHFMNWNKQFKICLPLFLLTS
jgi:hypothetical protein